MSFLTHVSGIEFTSGQHNVSEIYSRAQIVSSHLTDIDGAIRLDDVLKYRYNGICLTNLNEIEFLSTSRGYSNVLHNVLEEPKFTGSNDLYGNIVIAGLKSGKQVGIYLARTLLGAFVVSKLIECHIRDRCPLDLVSIAEELYYFDAYFASKYIVDDDATKEKYKNVSSYTDGEYSLKRE